MWKKEGLPSSIQPLDAETWDLKKLTFKDVAEIRDAQMALPLAEIDMDLVKECDRILSGDAPIDEPQMQRTWEKVAAALNQNSHAEKGGVRRLRRAALLTGIAAVLALAMVTVALASGILPWRLIIGWDNDSLVLRIESNNDSEERMDVSYSLVLGEEMITMLRKNEVNVQLPSFLPEGFTLYDVATEDDLPAGECSSFVTAGYKNGEAYLTIDVTRLDTGSSMVSLEKDNQPVEILEREDIEFRLFENLGSVVAQWEVNPYVVIISGDITREEMKEMIWSIKY